LRFRVRAFPSRPSASRPSTSPDETSGSSRSPRSARSPRALVAVSLALGALTAGAVPGALGPAVAASASHPLMFGAAASSRSDVEAHERVLGKRLNGLRVYKKWDGELFGRSQTWARDTGHTLFVSIRAEHANGSPVKFADISNAKPGSRLYTDMQRQARQIKAFGAKVYIAFNHEPEARASWGMGNGPQFVAAWRKLVSVYRAEGVTNAEYVFAGTAYGFVRKDDRRVALYYPGDAWVDHIAADGYNWYRCRQNTVGWTDLARVIEGQRQFGLQHPDEGLMLWEFGSAEDRGQPGRKAQWLRNVTQLFQQPGWGQYNTVLTWEGRNYEAGDKCGFDYTSSSSAKQAWVDMGHNPAFSATRVN